MAEGVELEEMREEPRSDPAAGAGVEGLQQRGVAGQEEELGIRHSLL